MTQELSKLTVVVPVGAPMQTVWDCITQAEHIVEWNFASPEWHCPAAMNDLCVGGRFSYRMAAKDESFEFDLEGIFTKVEEPYHLGYTLADGRKVEINLEQAGDLIMVTQTFEAENENPKDMQQAGWQAILNNMQLYTERHLI
jgi:uncharacterized protein YndB with AHSA1/START domain